MKRIERLNTILEILADKGSVSVDEIIPKLNISAATARRDLDTLAEQHLLTRTRGGAVGRSVAYDLPLRYKNHQHPDTKERIARAANNMIPPGAVVGLSGGTTTTAIAQLLEMRADVQESPTPELTVVTNAVNIAAQLATRPGIKVIVTGGVLNPRSYELVGGFAEQTLASMTLDMAFIGANGVDPYLGASAHDEREAAVNRFMASRARQAILAVDPSKMGVQAFAVMGDATLFSTLITDSSVTLEQHQALIQSGYEVILAE